MPDAATRARSAGFDDYWTKPIDVPRILADLDRLAGAQAVHDRGADRLIVEKD